MMIMLIMMMMDFPGGGARVLRRLLPGVGRSASRRRSESLGSHTIDMMCDMVGRLMLVGLGLQIGSGLPGGTALQAARTTERQNKTKQPKMIMKEKGKTNKTL